MARQRIQAVDPNSTTDRDEISRRLLEVLDRHAVTGPTAGNAPTGDADDATLQRHQELLARLNDVLASMESQVQQLQPDRPTGKSEPVRAAAYHDGSFRLKPNYYTI
jgi:hypothetical protein